MWAWGFEYFYSEVDACSPEWRCFSALEEAVDLLFVFVAEPASVIGRFRIAVAYKGSALDEFAPVSFFCGVGYRCAEGGKHFVERRVAGEG